MSWQTLPMVTCPHCGRQIQVNDYYDLSSGDSFTCAKCEKEIFIWGRDTVVSIDVHIAPELEIK